MEKKKRYFPLFLKESIFGKEWIRMDLCPCLYDFVLYFTDQGMDSRKFMVGQTWDKGLNVLEVSFRS